jgi:hypothetical protein
MLATANIFYGIVTEGRTALPEKEMRKWHQEK